MRVAFSLLVNYQICEHAYDWEIGVHGILIKFEVRGRHYNATYLPEVAKEQGWNHAQAVATLIQKTGIQGTVTPELLRNMHCTRYESSKCRVTFDEYKMIRGGDADALLELEQPQSSSCTNM
jgi:AMMECR1 domain-containing protein